MISEQDIERLQRQIDDLKRAQLPPLPPPAPPQHTAEHLLEALNQTQGAVIAPVLVSPQLFDAVQEYAKQRLIVQLVGRAFQLVRTEQAPPLSEAIAAAVEATDD